MIQMTANFLLEIREPNEVAYFIKCIEGGKPT